MTQNNMNQKNLEPLIAPVYAEIIREALQSRDPTFRLSHEDVFAVGGGKLATYNSRKETFVVRKGPERLGEVHISDVVSGD